MAYCSPVQCYARGVLRLRGIMRNDMSSRIWRHAIDVARSAASAGSVDEIAAAMLPAVARAFDSPLVAWYRVERDGMSGRVAPGMPDPFPGYLQVAAADPYQEIKRRLNPRIAVISDLV